MRTNTGRGKGSTETEDKMRTRTADKGHIETGKYILNKRGPQDDKKPGKRKVVMVQGRGKNDKPQEMRRDTNDQTGSMTD